MTDSAVVPPGAAVSAAGDEVAALQNALALERAKNEVLLEQVLKAEDSLADKDLEGFSDVVANEDREFWRGQLLENREAAVGTLTRLRCRVKSVADVPPVAVPPSQPKPLHNRETVKPAVADKGYAGPAVDGGAAAKLRNRAQEIAKRDGCSFSVAFRRAELESGEVH